MTLPALDLTLSKAARTLDSNEQFDKTVCAVSGIGAADSPRNTAAKVRAVIVAPTFDNAATLAEVLWQLDLIGLDVIVVDDGSTDRTRTLLTQWAVEKGRHHVVRHPVNAGKAAALHTGFAEARRLGFTHAVSIDTDGQLSPGDVPKLLQIADEHPDAMVLGVRDYAADDYPARSRVGRWISNQLIRLETGRRIADSQCGLRVYPLALVDLIYCRSGHYGFETEIITRAVWAGTDVVESPVSCRYFSGEARVSHFKPVRDSARALALHGRLIFTALKPFGRKLVAPGASPRHSLPRQFLHWLNPVTAWRQVRHTEGARVRFSLGFAVGIFIANLPIYGLQSLTGLFVARKFRLSPLSVFAGVNVSVPPIGPIMIACGIAIGHLILHGSLPHWQNYHLNAGNLHQVLLPTIAEWLLGSVIFGAISGAVCFVVMDVMLRLVSDPKKPVETVG